MGAFLDIPLTVKDLTFHTELTFSNNNYSLNYNTPTKEVNFTANIYSLNLPLLFRYTFPKKKTSPYIEFGGLYVYYLSCKNQIQETKISSNIIDVGTPFDTDFISQTNFGISIGAGLEHKLSLNHSIYFGTRYNLIFATRSSETLGKMGFDLYTAINF